MSRRSNRDDGLREITAEELACASADDLEADDEYLAALAKLRAAEESDARARAAAAELARIRREQAVLRLTDYVYPDVIGGGRSSTGHPSEGTDLVVGSSPAQLLANVMATFGNSPESFPHGCAIALIPVRLWPIAIRPSPDGKASFGIKGEPFIGRWTTDPNTGARAFVPTRREDGSRLTNWILGQTRINGSYASAHAYHPGQKKVLPLSLTAFATVSVNPYNSDPNEAADHLDRSAQWERWSSVGDGRITRTEKAGLILADIEDPPFIPTDQLTSSTASESRADAPGHGSPADAVSDALDGTPFDPHNSTP